MENCDISCLGKKSIEASILYETSCACMLASLAAFLDDLIIQDASTEQLLEASSQISDTVSSMADIAIYTNSNIAAAVTLPDTCTECCKKHCNNSPCNNCPCNNSPCTPQFKDKYVKHIYCCNQKVYNYNSEIYGYNEKLNSSSKQSMLYNLMLYSYNKQLSEYNRQVYYYNKKIASYNRRVYFYNRKTTEAEYETKDIKD